MSLRQSKTTRVLRHLLSGLKFTLRNGYKGKTYIIVNLNPSGKHAEYQIETD